MSEPKKKPPKVIVPPKPTPSERAPAAPSDAEPTACAVCHNPKTGEKCAACGN